MRLSGIPRSQAPRSPIQLLTAISVAQLYEKANQKTNEQFRPIKNEIEKIDQ